MLIEKKITLKKDVTSRGYTYVLLESNCTVYLPLVLLNLLIYINLIDFVPKSFLKIKKVTAIPVLTNVGETPLITLLQ